MNVSPACVSYCCNLSSMSIDAKFRGRKFFMTDFLEKAVRSDKFQRSHFSVSSAP